MSSRPIEYPLARAQREYARLALQADLLQPMTRRLFQEAGIGPGMRVLDLGSGAGDVCLLLASMVGPEGAVIGVDTDANAIAHAQERAAAAGAANVTFVQADLAHYEAHCEPGAPFDAVVGRLVLMYQPDPAAVLERMVRSLRPGGAVAMLEMWIMPRPGDSQLTRVMNLIVEALRRSGGHLDMGPRLHRVFQQAGLPCPEMRFEALIDGRDGSPLYRYCAETFASVLPKLIDSGLVAPGQIDPETIPADAEAEMKAVGYAMVALPMIGAWCRKP